MMRVIEYINCFLEVNNVVYDVILMEVVKIV